MSEWMVAVLWLAIAMELAALILQIKTNLRNAAEIKRNEEIIRRLETELKEAGAE